MSTYTAHLTTAALGTTVYTCRDADTFVGALYLATLADHVDYFTVTGVRVVEHPTGRVVFTGRRFAAYDLYPVQGCERPPVAVCAACDVDPDPFAFLLCNHPAAA
jgi:hypothetical protein